MKIIVKRILWTGRFIRSVLIKYSDIDLEEGSSAEAEASRDWEAVERVNCSGIVAIVPFTDENEVLMIRQFRPPVNRHVIELPAGLSETGELPADSARRELIEETGYSAGSMRFLMEGPLSSGLSSEILTVYVAEGLKYVGIGERDETEKIEVLKAPLDGMDEFLDGFSKAGDYVDLKVYGLVAQAKKQMK